MKVPVIAFCNNRAGVGTTTTIYHLSWMLSDFGSRPLLVDLDPQAELSILFRGHNEFEHRLQEGATIYKAITQPSWQDSRAFDAFGSAPALFLGDPRLAQLDDPDRPTSDDLIYTLRTIFSAAAESCNARSILIDLGPSLAAVNRAALLASDYLVVPMVPDLLSVHGLRNLGEALRGWRKNAQHLERALPLGYVIGSGSFAFLGPYALIPEEFDRAMLAGRAGSTHLTPTDSYCLGRLRPYPSLMPMAREAHKPMFHLKPADGAIGSHFQAAQSAGKDFEKLARRIAADVGLKIPQFSGA